MRAKEKFYNKLEHPTCPRCQERLEYEDQGCWYCNKCPYSEYNNIERCSSDWCDNLILCKDFAFLEMKDRFCQEKGEHGETCLLIAQGEAEQAYYEDLKMQEHIKGCTRDDCECRNY